MTELAEPKYPIDRENLYSSDLKFATFVTHYDGWDIYRDYLPHPDDMYWYLVGRADSGEIYMQLVRTLNGHSMLIGEARHTTGCCQNVVGMVRSPLHLDNYLHNLGALIGDLRNEQP